MPSQAQVLEHAEPAEVLQLSIKMYVEIYWPAVHGSDTWWKYSDETTQ